MAEQTARDAKLVQFLTEAYQKEAELEADLTAHISLTQKDSHRKRLEAHLKETRDHKRRVSSRIKQLGGDAPSAGPQLPGVPSAAGELVGKGVAAVKGQVGVARALVTEQAETHLRLAREELREEFVEIGLYTAIKALAEQVGDRDTASLCRDILRDERKMANYLERAIPALAGDVVRAEIPRDQRASSGRRKSSSRKRSSSSRKSTAKKSTAKKATAKKSTAKKSASRKTTSASRKTKSAARKTKSAARKTAKSASRATKSTARKAKTSAKKTRTTAGRKAGGRKSSAKKR